MQFDLLEASQHTSAALTINENYDPGEISLVCHHSTASSPLSMANHFSDVRKGTRYPTLPFVPALLIAPT